MDNEIICLSNVTKADIIQALDNRTKLLKTYKFPLEHVQKECVKS